MTTATTTAKIMAGLFTAGLILFGVKGPEQPCKSHSYSSVKTTRLDNECLSKLRDTAYMKSGEVMAKLATKNKSNYLR